MDKDVSTGNLRHIIEKNKDTIRDDKLAIPALRKMITFLTKNKSNLIPELLVKPFNISINIIQKYFHNFGTVYFHPGIFSHHYVFLGDKDLLNHLSLHSTFRSKKITTINGTFYQAPMGIVYHNWNDRDSTQFLTTNSKLTCRYHGHYQKYVLAYFIMYLRVVILTAKLRIKYHKKIINKNQKLLNGIIQKRNAIRNGKYSWDKIINDK